MTGPLSVACGQRRLQQSGGEQSAIIARKYPRGKENNRKDVPASNPSAQGEYWLRGCKASIYSTPHLALFLGKGRC